MADEQPKLSTTAEFARLAIDLADAIDMVTGCFGRIPQKLDQECDDFTFAVVMMDDGDGCLGAIGRLRETAERLKIMCDDFQQFAKVRSERIAANQKTE